MEDEEQGNNTEVYLNKKLSYCRETALHAMLVTSCYYYKCQDLGDANRTKSCGGTLHK